MTKTVPIEELKENAEALIDFVTEGNNVVELTNRGYVVARIVAADWEQRTEFARNQLRDMGARIVGDIEESFEEEWETK